jgi:hypothetical protein
VFTAAQQDDFIERGYVKVEAAFPRTAALDVQDYLWERLGERQGIVRDDPTTWKHEWHTIGSKDVDFARFGV